MSNRVRASTQRVLADDTLEHVSIDESRLDDLGDDLVDRGFTLPDWRSPVTLDEAEHGPETVFDFFLIGNTLNFVFDDLETTDTFATTYDGERWTGAYAMWACLKRAVEEGTDVTSGDVLADLTPAETRELFRGDPPIPLLDRRHTIVRHLGERLCALGDGTFHSVFPPDEPLRMYDDGDGLVEWLTRELPDAYADSRTYRGETVYFDKQAQLSAGMVEGRFRESDLYTVADFDEMTIFADYLIPALLREHGVFVYSTELARTVDSQTVLAEGEQLEVEIRLATIAAGDRLLERLDDVRDEPVTGFHLDQLLWQVGRNRELRHHFTDTTTY